MSNLILQTTDTSVDTGRGKSKSEVRTIAACSIGNALEMYDFTVYSYFAMLIGKLFFPMESAYGSLLLAVGTFGIGFVMRPLGALVIGSFADRRGRKAALTLTISVMVTGTLCIAFAPTFTTAGTLGTLIVVCGRLMQGFSLGGEIGASTAMLMESGSFGSRGFRISWQGASQGCAAVLGALSGAVLYANLSQSALESWGWRMPFLLGLLIAPVGLYIRTHLDETLDTDATEPHPLAKLFTEHRSKILLGVLSIVAATVGMYLVVFFMPTYMVRVLHLPTSLSLMAGCVSGATMTIMCLVSGWIADRTSSRKPLALASIILTTLLIYPAFWAMNLYPSVPLALAITAIVTAVSSFGSAPMFLLLMEMFPTAVRASGLSVIYSIGVALFGGSAQFIVTWLLTKTGNPMSLAQYMVACGIVTVFAMSRLPEPRKLAS
ncbi:MFS transporter [Burkholderia vietnamiensis]|uniref:MFS transporter n=1 Tax=Burkholderia vietnamiensis TaxID=60552 RepID=A0AAW7SVT1_BURVI|nr:MFS transporter [Burkholderia vietnamiensis]MBH9645880.1 MFS transporter [Burkholderia vietnamiensis]MBR8008811.1 MFS transporter [Burkholderia vietnamiensis]MDN7551333.1 MFS transporter [Burkholderia vietnamiensis]MDN7795147.1 MFS transporter [Burkholderia vietnamiensis]MDN8073716.1 MFS transporter [Burkholderia vietnamiensis]